MVGWIFLMIFFFIVVAACCSSDSSSSSGNTTRRNTTSRNTRSNRGTYIPSYSECPSCGAPYYDGYCEECGYPDINQGWIGENY